MLNYYPILLILSVFSALVVEGLGIENGHEISLYLTIFSSVFFFSHLVIYKKKVKVPLNLTALLLLFIFFTGISVYYSFRPHYSFLFFLEEFSLFLFFLCFYNYKDFLEKYMEYFIYGVSVLYILYSFLLQTRTLNLIVPQNGYQFVFANFSSHNHLGDFLTLPVIYLLYKMYQKKHIIISALITTCFLPFIIFSYSRSAYASIGISLLLLHLFSLVKKHNLHYAWGIRIASVGLLVSIVFLITISSQQPTNSLSSKISRDLVEKSHLSPNRNLISSRLLYVQQSLATIQKYPFIGIGPNNFVYASKISKLDPISKGADSAHNIFLEIAVGQGLLGLIPFIGFIIILLVYSEKKVSYFIFITMLINFQTDYTYQIHSFYLLFFMFAAIIAKDKEITLPAFFVWKHKENL